MKRVARACVAGWVVLASLCGPLACFPLAPVGGDLPDASGSSVVIEGGIVTIDATLGVDGDAGGSSSESGTAGDAGDAADAIVPTAPYPSPTLAAGVAFGCMIDTLGEVVCWGANGFGQAGSKPTGANVTAPQVVAGVANATAIALGDDHACAVTASHAVYCWGLNDAYQLGHPPATAGDLICQGASAGQTVPCSYAPSLVNGVSAVSVSSAGAWTCAVGLDGTVQCWGAVQATTASNEVDCGIGTQAQGGSCYPLPYPVAGLGGVTQLAVGYDHACATLDGGQVACWGNNNEGQISPLACPLSVCPVTTPSVPAASSVAAGNQFTCALGADGGVVTCFGDNVFGQLGHPPGSAGDTDPDAGKGVFNTAPTPASALPAAAELTQANQAACALVGGVVECWGNVASDAGPGVPIVVGGLPPVRALGSIDSTYACAAAADGGTWCWYLVNGAGPTQVR